MAETTTRKLLIDVEARYASVDQAMRRMADLSVEIRALQDLRKQEGKATDANKATLASLNTALKAAQKEYNQLNGYVAANVTSARALETAMGGVDDTILSLQAQLTRATLAWKGLTGAQRDSESGQALKARIEALTKSLFDNGTQLDRNKITVGNYAGEIEGLLVKLSKEGQVVGASSQAYSELLMSYQVAEAKAREYVLTLGEQSNEAQEAVADLKRMGAELDRLNTTMGKYQSKTFNASYATFSLSQVVRELPNFAIDARLGFMALSNNLPMLADDFNRLKRELGGFGPALKAFGKSLLGLNTIMVILATVLVAWGPKILDLIKNTSAAEKAHEGFRKELEKGSGTYGTAVEGLVRAGIAVEQYKNGALGAQRFISLMNKSVGSSVQVFKEQGEALEWYESKAEKYIQALYQQEKANHLITEAVKQRMKAEAILDDARNVSFMDGTIQSFKILGRTLADVRTILNPYAWAGAIKEMGNIDESVYQSRKTKAGKFLTEYEEILTKAKTSLTKAWEGMEGLTADQETATRLSQELSLRQEYAESLIKAEEGYQRQDFQSKQSYEKRLFEAQDKAERELLANDFKYKQLSQGEYDTHLAILDNRRKEFNNNQRFEQLKHNEEMLDLELDYQIASVKAEQGYQDALVLSRGKNEAERVLAKIGYEDRIFKLEDEAERKRLELQKRYGYITSSEYKKRMEVLDQQKAEFANKQTAEVEANAKKAKDNLLKLLKDTEEIELANTAKLYDDTLAAYEASLGDKSKLSGEQIYEMMDFELMVEYQKQEALAEIKAEYRKKESEMNRASIIQAYAQELELAKKGITERYGITKKRIDDELALLDRQYGENAKMSEKDAKRYRELLEERTANDKAYEENKLAVREEFMSKGMELVSALSDISDALGEREEQQAEDRHDRESESLKRNYDRGLISKKSYDAQQLLLDKKLDAEKAKIARAQAIRERLLATFSIGINTAKAIMGIWADFPKVDFGISAAAMSAVVGALGLAQAAAVWATPIPKASKGLLIHGPSHAGGGVPIEAEGGEAIINAKSTSMFRPLLSAINKAGGGVKFASGGIPVGLMNDGGVSARQALSGTLFPTAEDIARAVAGLELSVSVEQIEKGRAKYAKVKSRGTY